MYALFSSILMSTQEAWYYMAAPKKVTHKDMVRESTTLHATTSIDSDLQKALCDSEQGFMRAGAMPSVTAASSAGCKQILDAVGKALCFKSSCFNSSLVPYPKSTKYLLEYLDAFPIAFGFVNFVWNPKKRSQPSTSHR